MCFDHDYADWSAEVCDIQDTHNHRHGTRCCECGLQIPIGARIRTIYMREHESCDCDHCYTEGHLGDQCEQDYGEEWTGSQCEMCCQLLQAIAEVEQAEGCPEYASQPIYGDLYDSLEMIGYDSIEKYYAHAEQLFPGLLNKLRVACSQSHARRLIYDI